MAWSSSPRPCGRNSWLSGRARPGKPRRAREPRLGRPPQSSVETPRETRETRRESGKREERLSDLDSAKKHGRCFFGRRCLGAATECREGSPACLEDGFGPGRPKGRPKGTSRILGPRPTAASRRQPQRGAGACTASRLRRCSESCEPQERKSRRSFPEVLSFRCRRARRRLLHRWSRRSR